MINETEERETPEVAPDVQIPLIDCESGLIGESLSEAIELHANYFDFYTLDDEVVFIAERITP